VKSEEILGQMLLSWHNIAFFQALMIRIRAAITAGTFDILRADLLSRWQTKDA
jgi:queuine tRNA-ribosyltransferase